MLWPYENHIFHWKFWRHTLKGRNSKQYYAILDFGISASMILPMQILQILRIPYLNCSMTIQIPKSRHLAIGTNFVVGLAGFWWSMLKISLKDSCLAFFQWIRSNFLFCSFQDFFLFSLPFWHRSSSRALLQHVVAVPGWGHISCLILFVNHTSYFNWQKASSYLFL